MAECLHFYQKINFSTMETLDIKQSLSIEKVLQHYGLQPNKNQMLNCPFHKDGQAKFKNIPKNQQL